jgi:hypothetical protein
MLVDSAAIVAQQAAACFSTVDECAAAEELLTSTQSEICNALWLISSAFAVAVVAAAALEAAPGPP